MADSHIDKAPFQISRILMPLFYVVATGLTCFYLGQKLQKKPVVPFEQVIKIEHGHVGVHLGWEILGGVAQVNKNDLLSGIGGGGGGSDESSVRLLGTKYFPTPPYPTLSEYKSLKQEVVHLLSKSGIEDIPYPKNYKEDPTTGEKVNLEVNEPDTSPILLVVTRMISVGGGYSLMISVKWVETRFNQKTNTFEHAEPHNSSEYTGARLKADTKDWVKDAILQCFKRFLSGYESETKRIK